MTAYVVPPFWEHGDFPNAVDLDKISNAQKHLHENTPTTVQHPLAFYNTNDSVQQWIVITHTYKYLYYFTDGSEAKIMKYSPDYSDNIAWGSETWLTNNSETLSETNGNLDALVVAFLDLESIEWLDYGDQYVVFDVWGAYEYDESYLLIEDTPPFATGNLLSASALNSLANNVQLLKGTMDSPSRPRFLGDNDRLLFKKLGDTLVLKGTVLSDTLNSITIKISQNPGSMGSPFVTYDNGGSGYAENDTFNFNSIDISSLTDDENYVVEVTKDGSGDVRIEQAYVTD